MNNTNFHIPVMKHEAISHLISDRDGIYIDATLGYGGHSRHILEETSSKSKLFAIDKDVDAIEFNKKELSEEKRFTLKHGCFSSLDEYARTWNIYGSVNGILFDLGVSSVHLDSAERGFSFMREGELDMRFDNSSGMSAKEWINSASEKELADVFYFLGEERKSRQFAKKIIQARKDTNISSTKNLAELFKPKGFQKKHPATNIFRGIRILINNEFEELKEGLISAIKVLKDRGILAVISFHSAEDRIVKNFFKKDYKNFFEGINLKNVNKIKPSKEEKSTNPRSRSAILRIGEIEYVS